MSSPMPRQTSPASPSPSNEHDDGILEARIPKDLNPWSGVAQLGLHSHTADQPCTDQCTEYSRDEGCGYSYDHGEPTPLGECPECGADLSDD